MSRVVILHAVNQRTAPNVNAYASKLHPAGTVVELSDLLTDDKGDVWGKIASKDGAFIAVHVRGKTYCVELEASTPAQEWMQAVDAFLRNKGYAGPRP